MSKVAAASTLSSDVFSLGNMVAFEDYLEVVEQQNYSAAENVQRFSWVGDLTLAAGVVGLVGEIWIPPWAYSVFLFIEWSGSGADVAVNATNWAPATGTQSTTLLTSSTGTGWQEFRITGGTGSVTKFRIQVGPTPAAGIPSPVVE